MSPCVAYYCLKCRKGRTWTSGEYRKLSFGMISSGGTVDEKTLPRGDLPNYRLSPSKKNMIRKRGRTSVIARGGRGDAHFFKARQCNSLICFGYNTRGNTAQPPENFLNFHVQPSLSAPITCIRHAETDLFEGSQISCTWALKVMLYFFKWTRLNVAKQFSNDFRNIIP